MLTIEDIDFDEDLHYIFVCTLAESSIQSLRNDGFIYAEVVRCSFEASLDEIAKGEVNSPTLESELLNLYSISVGADQKNSRAIEVVRYACIDLIFAKDAVEFGYMDFTCIEAYGNLIDPEGYTGVQFKGDRNNITDYLLKKYLSEILDYKIKNKQSFKNPEKIFDLLTGDDIDKFIFNMEILNP